jgi:hypothetical protein
VTSLYIAKDKENGSHQEESKYFTIFLKKTHSNSFSTSFIAKENGSHQVEFNTLQLS